MPTVSLHHGRKKRSDRPEQGQCIHLERAFDFLFGNVQKGLAGDDARVVDQYVDRTAVSQGPRRDRCDCVPAREIAGVDVDFMTRSSEFRLELGKAGGIDIPQNQPGPCVREPPGKQLADATGGTCNERSFTDDVSHFRQLPESYQRRTRPVSMCTKSDFS
jgi:hypothetical protein